MRSGPRRASVRTVCAETPVLRSLLGWMQPGAVLLFHLLHRKNFAAKARELDEFLLNCLQSFLPLAVSYLSLPAISTLQSILLGQFLNLSNLSTQTTNLFPKNFDVIHDIRIAYLDRFQRRSLIRPEKFGSKFDVLINGQRTYSPVVNGTVDLFSSASC
jgi:hypothetical protein